MLKILVCVKQIPDVDLVKMDPETGNLIRTGVPTLTNPLDLNALEAAVQVKERFGGEITLITMGPPMAESTLRECLAVGGDEAVLISGRPFGGADTLATSYSIVKAAEMKGQVRSDVKQRRYDRITSEQQRISLEHNLAFIGRTLPVLVEEIDEDGSFIGRSPMDAPDIDNNVLFTGPQGIRPGDIVDVEITDAFDYDLCGKAVEL